MFPRLLTAPKPKQGDASRHVFEVAFYATEAGAKAGGNDWLLVEWFEVDYLRAVKNVPVLAAGPDGKPMKIGEAPGDGQPEEDIKELLDRWLASPANRQLRGDLRTRAAGGAPPPPTAAVDPHGVRAHAKVAAMVSKPIPKPARSVAEKGDL